MRGTITAIKLKPSAAIMYLALRTWPRHAFESVRLFLDLRPRGCMRPYKRRRKHVWSKDELLISPRKDSTS